MAQASSTATGEIWASGYNGNGELGNGTLTNTVALTKIAGAGTGFTQVSAGHYHSYGLTASGQLYAWGYNNYGQLGNNSIVTSSTPVLVTTPADPVDSANPSAPLGLG